MGRPELDRCVAALAAATGPAPEVVVVVDDRPGTPDPLPLHVPPELAARTLVLATGGGGPAGARNMGWRAVPPAVGWIAFLDDDVEVSPTWRADLVADLRAAGPDVGAVQGRLDVPLPRDRRPTDWERGTRGLADAAWATADMAYRRDVLVETGGFDPRFRRAFREDADLALRSEEAGWILTRGDRRTRHPVRPTDRWVSVRVQAGNADDVLMTRLHGGDWYRRAAAPRGRRRLHMALTALAVVAGVAAPAGRRRVAIAAAAGWLVGTVEFAAARIRPGPRDRHEVTTMIATSVLIPPAATAHWLRGQWRHRGVGPTGVRPKAVLFDRDGTLVRDVPYNDQPDKVEPMPGAVEAVRMLRAAGIRTAVVSNQSGVGRGLISPEALRRVNARVDAVFGPFEVWECCVHRPEDDCPCRKPRPGLIEDAARRLGVRPDECVVIGDIGADVAAARAAGARSVLVPTDTTRAGELAGARVAGDLGDAVRLVLRGLR
ncbi:HAD family hydrolase [Embleya scabrispora]|uniref:D,D-heptose 1,7-bisphosphate phosphatase n=2 Tax=Embleya scabrispora TaxID=159449 RepID=A0A1T3P6N1_9ACTN|nr:HAD family hydrolase [Embleya scabrispora]